MVPGLRRQQSGSELLAAVQVLRLSVGREDQPQRQLSALLGDCRRPLALHGVHYSGADPKPTSLDHLQVVSVNSIGVGPPSNTVTATTAEEGRLLNLSNISRLLTTNPIQCRLGRQSLFEWRRCQRRN